MDRPNTIHKPDGPAEESLIYELLNTFQNVVIVSPYRKVRTFLYERTIKPFYATHFVLSINCTTKSTIVRDFKSITAETTINEEHAKLDFISKALVIYRTRPVLVAFYEPLPHCVRIIDKMNLIRKAIFRNTTMLLVSDSVSWDRIEYNVIEVSEETNLAFISAFDPADPYSKDMFYPPGYEESVVEDNWDDD